MNLKTTLVLLLLAVLLGGLLLFLTREGPRELRPEGRLFFTGLQTADVTEVLLEDRSHQRPSEPLKLSRGEDGWTMTSPARPGARPARVRLEAVEELISAVQDLAWIRKVATLQGPEVQRYGFGELQKAIITLRRRGQDSIVIELGAEVGFGGILCRKGGTMEVYEVDTGVRDQLLPTAEELRDPRLLSLSALAVRRLEVKDRQGTRFAIAREFAGWFLTEPFAAPADRKRTEELRNELMALTVAGYGLGTADPTELPRFEVRIDVEGREEPVRLLFGDLVDDRLQVIVEGRPERFLVAPDILSLLDRDAGDYRDRRVFAFPSAQVAAAKVTREAARNLDIRRVGNRFILSLHPDDPSFPIFGLDPVEAGTFLDRLVSLELEETALGDRSFEASLLVDIVRKVPDQATEIAYRVVIGAADERGRRPVRVEGEAAVGRVSEDDIGFLLAPYWQLLERAIITDGAYWELARIEISDADGEPLVLRGSIGRDGNLEAHIGEATQERSVPRDLLDKVIPKLVYFTVQDFLGEDRDVRSGWDRPFLRLRWFRSVEGTREGIPDDLDDGTWNEIVVAPPGDDGLYPARWNLHPDLVFALEIDDLNPFLGVLDWARR